MLALSDARDDSNPTYLFRNVLRDGRKLTRRSRRTEFLFDPTETNYELGPSHAGGSIQEPADARNTPEGLAVARDFTTRLASEVLRTRGEAGRICLTGLLRGASIGESAAASGLSTRQVRHTRSCIRRTAAQLYSEIA